MLVVESLDWRLLNRPGPSKYFGYLFLHKLAVKWPLRHSVEVCPMIKILIICNLSYLLLKQSLFIVTVFKRIPLRINFYRSKLTFLSFCLYWGEALHFNKLHHSKIYFKIQSCVGFTKKQTMIRVIDFLSVNFFS